MILVFIFLLFGSVFPREIPSYVPLCDRKDPEVAQCFINSVNTIKPYLVKGIPEMNVPPIDPLVIKTITLNSKESPSVNAVIVLKDIILRGFKDFTFEKHTMDFEKVIFFAVLHLPIAILTTNFDFKGRALLVDINTSGHLDLNATDITFQGYWYGSYYTKKGKQHIQIDKIAVEKLDIKHIDMQVGDLFEDKQTSKSVNDIINKNMDRFAEELNPVIRETIGEFLLDYFNKVYKLFPADQLYPPAN